MQLFEALLVLINYGFDQLCVHVKEPILILFLIQALDFDHNRFLILKVHI